MEQKIQRYAAKAFGSAALLLLLVSVAVPNSLPGSLLKTQTAKAAAPTMTAVTDHVSANGTVNRITITFSEAVKIVDGNAGNGLPSLALSNGCTIANANYASASTLTLQLSNLTGCTASDTSITPTVTYTAVADCNATNSICDAAGANQMANAQNTVAVDGTSPTITNVTSTTANGTYTGRDVVDVSVTFSESVTVTGTPRLTLETGANDEVVNYSAGSGTATLHFAYTVAAGDTSADLDYTGSLEQNGGSTIKDAAMNDADLSPPGSGTPGSLGANKAIVIDTSLTQTNVQPNTLENGKMVSVTVSFTTPTVTSNLGKAIATDDKILITFPAGFDVTNAANPASSTIDGNFDISSDNNAHTVLIARNGGLRTAQNGGEAESITFSGIRNPITNGGTGTYSIQLKTIGNQVKSQNLAVTQDVIDNGASNNNGANSGPVVWSPGGGVVAPSPAPAPAPSPSPATPPASPTPAPAPGTTTPADGTTTPTTPTTPTDGSNGGTVTPGLPFTDVGGHWAVEFIKKLYDLKVVNGRTPTTFAPDAYLTRAELVKISMLLFGYEVKDGESCKDVKTTAWYHSVMATAKAAGIIKGYADGTCRGDAFVNRAEALTILLRASKKDTAGAKANPFKDGQGWFTKDLNAAYEWGVVSGKTTTMFMPGDNVTRAEVSKMAVKLKELMK